MLLADRPLPRLRMLGELPPLTNGLHTPEPPVTRSERTNLGEVNATLPPGTRVLPPLRGAPRISSSLSQPDGDSAQPFEGGLRRPQETGDLQSFNSAADLQAQRDDDVRTADSNTVVSEDDGGCSPLSRLFRRLRKNKPITHEAVTPETPEEPKEEPDDESRPEGAALRAGLPTEYSPPDRTATPAVITDTSESEEQGQQPTDPVQSKTCSIL